MDISIIIPVFNEENTVAALHENITRLIKELGASCEMIFINDGSFDASPRILQQLKSTDSGVIVINFEKRYGKESALAAGFSAAKGEKIITIDSDMQIDSRDILRILDGLRDSHAVIGYRTNRLETDGFIKFASSKIANYIRNFILRENFKDVGCSLQGYRRECLRGLKLYSGFHVYILSLLHNAGYTIKEIPIKTKKRQYGKSNFNIHNRIFKGLAALFVVKWMLANRLKYNVR
ncbi:MAG: glycosyltransferase [Candidatus Omnitrophota bacterium]|jgi:glycosyltransferase involved in cell wall biosynthesis